MSIDIVLQVLVGGVLLGGLYALVAFGLSLIYGVVRILNFAHGTILAVTGVVASLIFARWHVSPVLIFLVLVPCVFLLGAMFYRGMLHPLEKRQPLEVTIGTVLVTVGTLLILSDVTAVLAGPTQRNILLHSPVIEIGNIVVSVTQLAILGAIIVMTLVIHAVLKMTWFGLAVRAVTQEPIAAELCGARSLQVKTLTFGVGSATVAVAAVLYVLTFPVDPYMGFGLTVKAFTIIVVGGIGNLPGALIVGVLLGVAEGLVGLFWGPEWSPAISVILLLLILVAFPSGIRWRRA
jgi:branched-chain amino acid transport system permease protein